MWVRGQWRKRYGSDVSIFLNYASIELPNVWQVLHDGVLDLDLSECSISGHGLGYVTSLCPRLRKVDLNAPQGCRNDISSHGEQGK